MRRYRLAIFDFDGTLADSLPWFRASFQDMIARFDLAPVSAEELETMRGLSLGGPVLTPMIGLLAWSLGIIAVCAVPLAVGYRRASTRG